MGFTPGFHRDSGKPRWHMIDQGSHMQCSSVKTRMIKHHLHSFRHSLLHSIGMMHAVELLTPLIDLSGEVDLYRAHVVAGATERTSRAVAVMLVAVAEHTEIDTDRTGNEIRVGVPPRTTIYRTSVHTCAATHTLQSLPMVFIAEDFATTVVDEDYMHLRAGPRTPEMRSIYSSRLSGAVAGKESLEHSH